MLHQEVLSGISQPAGCSPVLCCVCTGLCEGRRGVRELKPLLHGSGCSVQTRPHCCSLFVGLPDLQTELAGALFPLVIGNSIEWSLNPVNVLLREIFLKILV